MHCVCVWTSHLLPRHFRHAGNIADPGHKLLVGTPARNTVLALYLSRVGFSFATLPSLVNFHRFSNFGVLVFLFFKRLVLFFLDISSTPANTEVSQIRHHRLGSTSPHLARYMSHTVSARWVQPSLRVSSFVQLFV